MPSLHFCVLSPGVVELRTWHLCWAGCSHEPTAGWEGRVRGAAAAREGTVLPTYPLLQRRAPCYCLLPPGPSWPSAGRPQAACTEGAGGALLNYASTLPPLVIVGDCAWSLPCFPASALHCWLLMTPFQNLQLGSALSSWPLCPLTLRALSSCEKDSHLCST